MLGWKEGTPMSVITPPHPLQVVYRCRCGAKQVFLEGERATCEECGLFLDPKHDLAPDGWEPSSQSGEAYHALSFHESPQQLAVLLGCLLTAGFAISLLGPFRASSGAYLTGWAISSVCNLAVLWGAAKATGVSLGTLDLAFLRAGIQVQGLQVIVSLGYLTLGADMIFAASVPLLLMVPALLVLLFRWNWLGSALVALLQTTVTLGLATALQGTSSLGL
jgi:hypothetical protein